MRGRSAAVSPLPLREFFHALETGEWKYLYIRRIFQQGGVKERDGYDGGGEADQEDCAENGG